MNVYEQFLREKYSGKYACCKYPNLIEIHGEMPTDYFANVTPELMLAVFRGEEDLEPSEIAAIAHYNNIPLTVLTCPKRIMLDMGRRRHRKMVAEIDGLYIQIKRMARNGNKKAEEYLEYACWVQQRFLRAAHDDKLSYGHYLAAKYRLKEYILFSTPTQKIRGVFRKGTA